VCTVLLRFAPGTAWPLLLAAVRDEFVDRPWDPPAAHWPAAATGLVGGRDRLAGGTWLAIRPDRPAVAALLNGVRLPPPADGVRPSRGWLPLAILSELDAPGVAARSVDGAAVDESELEGYDGFHLLLGDAESVTVWSWDGHSLTAQDLTPGDHILVNSGVNSADDALVPHFAPLLASSATPPLAPGDDTDAAWGPWVDLLRGDKLPFDDPRALIVRREFDGRVYGSTSASLVAVRSDSIRLDFTATPDQPDWRRVLPSQRRSAGERGSG
jgi:Transport and Golgi organisation 2